MKLKDRQRWETFGKLNPYWTVLADEKFDKANLDSERLEEFFLSGTAHIEHQLKQLEGFFGPMNYERALDYGCGVGRLSIPLARRFEKATGVDIAKSMLEEARKNSHAFDIKNTDFIHAADFRDHYNESLDFVHSFLVFQHMPVDEGLFVTEKLLDLLKPGGCGALQYYFEAEKSAKSKLTYFLKQKFKFVNFLSNILNRRKWNRQFVPMNYYDLNRLLVLFREKGIYEFHLESLHDRENSKRVGFILYFQK